MSRVVLGMVSILGLAIFAFSMASDRKTLGPISSGMDAHPTKSSSWSVPWQTPTETKANTSSSPSRQSAGAKRFYFLNYEGSHPGGSTFSLTNKWVWFIQEMNIDISLVDKDFNVEHKRAVFTNVYPGKTATVKIITSIGFYPIRAMLGNVQICRMEGRLYGDCGEFIVFSGG